MGIITAVRENRMRVIPFGMLLVLGWLFVNLNTVWRAMEPFDGFGDQYVGQSPVSGYIGLAVMVLALLFGVYLYAEAGETTPAPEEFPPR